MATCDRCENKIPGETLEPCPVCKHWIEKLEIANGKNIIHDEDLVDCMAKLIAENSQLRRELEKYKPTEKEPSDES
ncbi:MAG: hypothetical protein WCT26_01680 [Candidatus Buchananbacteria bacterium]|jgi:hypothetical protein